VNTQNGPFNFTIARFKHAAVLTHAKCGSISQVEKREYGHVSAVIGAAVNHYGLPELVLMRDRKHGLSN
jgi:hypothetical protein